MLQQPWSSACCVIKRREGTLLTWLWDRIWFPIVMAGRESGLNVIFVWQRSLPVKQQSGMKWQTSVYDSSGRNYELSTLVQDAVETSRPVVSPPTLCVSSVSVLSLSSFLFLSRLSCYFSLSLRSSFVYRLFFFCSYFSSLFFLSLVLFVSLPCLSHSVFSPLLMCLTLRHFCICLNALSVFIAITYEYKQHYIFLETRNVPSDSEYYSGNWYTYNPPINDSSSHETVCWWAGDKVRKKSV